VRRWQVREELLPPKLVLRLEEVKEEVSFD